MAEPVRISQAVVEYAVTTLSPARVSQVVVEYAVRLALPVRTSQFIIEYINPDDEEAVRISQVVIEYIVGAPLPPPEPEQQVVPKIMLRWSDDAGHTWTQPMERSFGETGEFCTYVAWHRLGRAKSRVFEVSTNATVPVRLLAAYLRVTPGTGQR